MLHTFGTLFSGGEGAGIGLQAAGLRHLWGVEYDPAIAGVAQTNGFDVMVADVRAVDYAALAPVDWLHASPVCTRASNANPNATESPEDIETAAAVVRALDAIRPQVFTLENVWGYRDFQAFKNICAALGEHGYFWDFSHENAADYGVPQTRKRLILRASRGLLPHLPPPVRWVGWYEAIEDLIPTLPESKLAPWQMARLPEELRESLLIANGKYGNDLVFSFRGEPSNTITGNSNQLGVRAALFENGNSSSMRPYEANEPHPTMAVGHSASFSRAWTGASVVSMTPRALARFQSVPDWYDLPEKRTLAARVIGNMVPPLLMQRIAENMKEAN